MTYDAVVIGTGFGGAVVACRLVQAGARICVLERGRRFEANDFTVAQEDSLDAAAVPLRRPGFHGLWDFRDLDGVQTLQASGYGGGSLIYAGVHLRPPADIFHHGWPEGYTREALDPYYDLAAHMLGVNPVTSSKTIKPLIKSQRLRSAAHALDRAQYVFEPPLAINFSDPKDRTSNSFGREQSGCRGCGRCMLGCPHGAKNSLDLNYLAVVEDARDAAGRPLADIYTLAEAIDIAPAFGTKEINHVFRVAYQDHLEHTRKNIVARWVFVCAGSLGSTELLLRSRPHLPGLGSALGRNFFCNADALGVVFDTREPSGMSEGPTIATSLLHRRVNTGGSVSDDSWILIQEGTLVPPLTVPTAGLRSEVWLGRNRYRERTSKCRDGASNTPAGHGSPKANPTAGRVMLPHLPPLGYSLSALSQDPGVSKMAPAQMRSAISTILQPFQARAHEELRSIGNGVIQRLVAESGQALAKKLGSFMGAGSRTRATMAAVATKIGMYGLELGKKVGGLSDDLLAAAVMSEIRARTGLAEPSRLADLLLALVPGTVPDESLDPQRCFVLLAMGRDALPGCLMLSENGLRAELDAFGITPVYDVEERLMRDIAGELGSELRISPFWESSGRPITVHPHGACAMGDDPKTAVVDSWGEAHGCPGLFVMDGSVIPRSLGVNPSATITAIAERNIEHHIRRYFKEGWCAPQWKTASAWRAATPDHIIDPLSMVHDRAEGSPTPVARPIGLTFVESMTGFHSDVSVNAGSSLPDRCEAAAADGRRSQQSISFELRCTVPEVRTFLADPNHTAQLEGTISVTCPAVGLNGMYAARGTMQVMVPAERDGEREFRYDLRFSKGVRRYRLEGLKRVRRHPGLETWKAMWSDTSVLLVRLISHEDSSSGEGRVVAHGVLRLPADRFLYESLPSLEVTGTSDPVRVAWTMGSFLEVFVGGLAAVHLRKKAPLRSSTSADGLEGERIFS